MNNYDSFSSSNPRSISEVAHKIRTPLTVIMSTVNNLLDGAFGDLSDEQKKWIKKLEIHTQTLEKHLDRILHILKEDADSAVRVQDALMGGGSPHAAEPSMMILKEATSGDASSVRRPLILAVDDEPDILDVIKEGLESKGLETITASNGETALRLAREANPDVVLMDVFLNHQNGIDIARQIKIQQDSYTPVILVTGQDDLREKVSGSSHEADDLLTKPFQIEELYTRVSSMLKLKKLQEELANLRQR
jgi:CheY-like chemotaxis protein